LPPIYAGLHPYLIKIETLKSLPKITTADWIFLTIFVICVALLLIISEHARKLENPPVSIEISENKNSFDDDKYNFSVKVRNNGVKTIKNCQLLIVSNDIHMPLNAPSDLVPGFPQITPIMYASISEQYAHMECWDHDHARKEWRRVDEVRITAVAGNQTLRLVADDMMPYNKEIIINFDKVWELKEKPNVTG
jgi:hypothetical protein